MRKLTRRSILVRSAVAAAAFAAACTVGLGPVLAAEKLNVVATSGYIADAIRNVGGDHVTVKTLLGPGVDPHLYRQTSSDIALATKADVVFWHGLHLEAQLLSFLEGLAVRKPVIALAESVPKDQLLSADADAALPDPHIWFDPRLWVHVVEAARDSLIRLCPEGKADFEVNAQRYLAEISKIADYASASLASVPASSRVLVTAHDAFNYFGRAYQFEVAGIQGISTESEAGLRRIEELVDMLVKRNIGAIFVESSVSDRNVKALIEGAAAKGHKVVVGGELFSDATGEAGTYEGTYIGVIDHNATIITRALGGGAPEKGISGQLAGM
ncbi:metal ABC transporter solute-binding protein, Zn/Mn family [Pseudochelatococcus sp. G4_1912]|uniref:metal ABC transporter solute-binding protein, Zn/Mn family n=1 Tax=Pseudochelatococcus sp. G4_1912 TaxID=3114288 RepID=UPI0039C6BBAC